jgi:hypothetical protein
MRKLIFAMNLMMIAALVLVPKAFAQDEEPDEVEFTCEVTEVNPGDGFFTCETEESEPYTVYPPEDVDLETLEVGEFYEVEGVLAEDDTVMAEKLDFEEPEEEDEGEEEDEEGGDEEQVGYFCRAGTEDLHPVAGALAETYETNLEQIMGWFCEESFGFGQIMLALQTAKMEEADAAELLARRAGGEGWGQIWVDMGVIGKDREADPPGGPPEWAGPPEHAGPKEGRGRPEDAGPPEGRGRPEHAGPKDGRGRPDHAGPPDRD